jgi:hypothetical protein
MHIRFSSLGRMVAFRQGDPWLNCCFQAEALIEARLKIKLLLSCSAILVHHRWKPQPPSCYI